MDLSRRHFIAAGVAGGAVSGLTPVWAGGPDKTMPAWHAGYCNAPEKGFAPATMKRVYGQAPAGLEGVLYRNGPGQMQHGEAFASHWFDGDGLIHKIAIADGEAQHMARFVDTPKRRDELAARKFLAPGFGTQGDPDYPVTSPDDTNAANTSVIVIDGKLYALWEAGSAYELDAETLATIGPKAWRDDLAGMPFTAHPKVEPDGQVWNIGVGGNRAALFKISKTGALDDFTLINLPEASYIHDWAMSERHLIILAQPWISTVKVPPFINGFEWRPELGMKILIIDKDDLTSRRWVQAPSRAFYHTGAAWEDQNGTIRVDAALYKQPVLGIDGGGAEIRGEWDARTDRFNSNFTQIVIPPSGDARLIETGLDGDFPRVHPQWHGRPRRLTALVTGTTPSQPGLTKLTVQDWQSGQADTFDFGADRMVEEFVFAPKPGGVGEADSWLIGPVLNIAHGTRELYVFDTARVSDGPVCIWQVDYTWPLGFHGIWV